MVDAELRGMAELLKMNSSWKYFINLSGQDFPLKSQEQIARFLVTNHGKEFIKVADQRQVRPDAGLDAPNFQGARRFSYGLDT